MPYKIYHFYMIIENLTKLYIGDTINIVVDY